MPPQLATLICVFCILYLFRADRKRVDGVSPAVWIPLIYMFLSGTRYLSAWVNLGPPEAMDTDGYPEGSPLDRAVFMCLIFSGVWVLMQRNVNWGDVFAKNAWVWVFFAFGATSLFWSDVPFISFKRWIKDLGNVVMALVILTEQRPFEALGVILRRLSFLILPISVLFIKYYPELGRSYHMGEPLFMGAALHKNSLGQICLIFGMYYCWELLLRGRDPIEPGRRLHIAMSLIVLPMLAWLFYMANSATSLTCMFLALVLFIVARHPAVRRAPRRLMTFGFSCIALFGLLQLGFDAKGRFIAMLGRRADLTDRIPMWEQLLSIVQNPLIGFGYESFWTGDRLRSIVEHWEVQQAHNGYLEIYLNLGLIGLIVVIAWIMSGLIKVWRQLALDYPAATLRLCFIAVVTLYNWTEATLHGVSNMFVLLLLGIMDVPGQKKPKRKPVAGAAGWRSGTRNWKQAMKKP